MRLSHAVFASLLAVGLLAVPAMAQSSKTDIVETASSSDNLKTLASAVQAAGLADTLKGDGPFTVFAPTDDAFAASGSAVEELLKPENKGKLTKVLTFHVVPGKVMSGDLKNGMTATTVEGEEITFRTDDGKVMVNDATVTNADIETSNGVVHIIDRVMMPASAM